MGNSALEHLQGPQSTCNPLHAQYVSRPPIQPPSKMNPCIHVTRPEHASSPNMPSLPLLHDIFLIGWARGKSKSSSLISSVQVPRSGAEVLDEGVANPGSKDGRWNAVVVMSAMSPKTMQTFINIESTMCHILEGIHSGLGRLTSGMLTSSMHVGELAAET